MAHNGIKALTTHVIQVRKLTYGEVQWPTGISASTPVFLIEPWALGRVHNLSDKEYTSQPPLQLDVVM